MNPAPMTHAFRHTLALALFAGAAFAHANTAGVLTLDPAGAQVRPVASASPSYRTVPAEHRQLSIAETQTLLASTEGSAWRISAVQAPQCSKGSNTGLQRDRKKSQAKECRQQKAECVIAKKFASKNKAHALCSSLYTQTTVLLTTK